MKPVIGVTVCIDAGQRMKAGVDYLYLRRAYAHALAQAGAIPVLLSPEASAEDCAALCHGLVISGGGDLPRRFSTAASGGDAPEGTFAEPEHPQRTVWERTLLDTFHGGKKPVLGVCYGMQLMNLHFGGSLYRSIVEEVPGALDHGGQGGHAEHAIVRSGDSLLLAPLDEQVRCNSSHGQAVSEVAAGFVVTARSDDGVIEAIENASGRLFGVEWHPESDATGERIYSQFIKLVMQRT